MKYVCFVNYQSMHEKKEVFVKAGHFEIVVVTYSMCDCKSVGKQDFQ